MKRLRQILRSTYHGLFSESLDKIYSTFDRGNPDWPSLRELVYSELQKIGIQYRDYETLDHGILGAVNITSRLGKTPIDENVKASIRAIAAHNLDEEIKLNESPITFLLVLCDELQEWGREIALFPEILIETSSMKIRKFKTKRRRYYFPDVLHISFNFLSSSTDRTNFKKQIFWYGKKSLLNRLIFDTSINPNEICFDT